MVCLWWVEKLQRLLYEQSIPNFSGMYIRKWQRNHQSVRSVFRFLQSVQPFCKSSVIFYYKGGEITRLRLYLQTIASMAICARRFYPPKGGGSRHSLTPDNKLFRPIRNNRLGSGGCEWREKSTRFFIIDREIRLYAAADQEKADLFCLAGRMYDICFMFYTGFKEVRPSLSSIKQCHLAHCTTKYFSMLTWN